MKLLLTITLIVVICHNTLGQNIIDTANINLIQPYTYAYITIEGKLFGKKLKVDVDFGETPEQLNAGKEFSNNLTNKKSYAAILNHMAENEFELVESRDYNYVLQGSSGIYGVIFIMRKKR